VNLSPAAMKDVYGDAVCARITAEGCALTAPAAAYMAIANTVMDGGHCFGMAAFAALLFDKHLRASTYGAPTAYELQDDGTVQTEIAKLFITQGTDPEQDSRRKVSVNEMIAALKQGWAEHKSYLLAIRSADGSSGHAVTPVALRALGDGQIGLVIYDNNYPGEQRQITLDPAADTWTYTTATNPSEASEAFQGDAANPMELFTPSEALKVQDCPFCRDDDDSETYVLLDPESAQAGVTLKVTDLQGNPLPGVETVPWAVADEDPDSSALVQVPAGRPYRVTMTGTKVDAGDTAPGRLTVIGHGWTDSVTAVQLSQGESDSITVDPSTGSYSFSSADAESPVLSNTVDEGGTSYQFAFRGTSIDANGGTYTVTFDAAKHTERIAASGTGPSTMRFAFSRIDATATHTFRTDDLTINSGEALVAHYGAWKGDGTPLTVGIDAGANGSVDRTVTLRDE
jgi:hypothetical protein